MARDPCSSWNHRQPKKALASAGVRGNDSVAGGTRVRRSKSRSAVFSAFAAVRWRIFVPHAIAAVGIAPMYARMRLGVERSFLGLCFDSSLYENLIHAVNR